MPLNDAKSKVICLYGGPGTGKSTTAAGLFYEFKIRGVNCEYVQEYAKDKAWEHGKNFHQLPKVFEAQEYIFGKQHFRLRRCADSVDLIVSDCPLMLGLIYTPKDFPIPSLRNCIREAYAMYDNFNVFLTRTKVYNPHGRLQTEERAREIDGEIRELLVSEDVPHITVEAGSNAVREILTHAYKTGWLKQLGD